MMLLLAVAAACLVASTTCAFVLPSQTTRKIQQLQQLDATSKTSTWERTIQKTVATAVVTASLWGAPAFVASPSRCTQQYQHALPTAVTNTVVASAKEMASGSGSRVNKDPESLLRLGLPINNKEVRAHISSQY